MKHHEVREHLEPLTRKELEDLSERIYGKNNASLRNKNAIISVLMQKHRRVAKELGIELGWWTRHSSHVYGVVGIVSLALGIIALLYPKSDAIYSAPVDLLRQQEILDEVARIRASPRPTGLDTPSTTRMETESVPSATKEGFELIEHSVVCDLRSFQSVSSVNQDKKLSPVVQHVRQIIRNVDGLSKYRLWSHTSGLDVYSQSNTHKGRLLVYTSEERRTVAKYLVRPRVLEFDVSEDPMDREFTIQVSKTFWNAFQNQDQSWGGLVVGLPTRSIKYLVIFPDEKPFKSFELFANDEQKNRIDLPTETYVLADPQKRWIWWNIVNPKPGNGYNVDWQW